VVFYLPGRPGWPGGPGGPGCPDPPLALNCPEAETHTRALRNEQFYCREIHTLPDVTSAEQRPLWPQVTTTGESRLQHRSALHYIILYYITLHYIILYYIILYYITLHNITLYYIILYYITLHYIILYYITLHVI